MHVDSNLPTPGFEALVLIWFAPIIAALTTEMLGWQGYIGPTGLREAVRCRGKSGEESIW